jgi:hypothetical protein
LNRSQLFARDLEAFIERHNNEAVTDHLNQENSVEQTYIGEIILEFQIHSIRDEGW